MICSLRCNNLNWKLIKTTLAEITQNKTGSLYVSLWSLYFRKIET